MTMPLNIEYAVRTLIYMGNEPHGTIFTIAAISQAYDIPEKFLRKIIPQLTKANLLLSQRGNGGGITLAKNAEEISLLDVIQAIDGDIFLNKCTFSKGFCHRTPWCEVRSVWLEGQELLKKFLTTKSIKFLATQTHINKTKLTA